MTQAWDFVNAAMLWQVDDAGLSTPIDINQFTTRVRYALRHHQVETIGDFVRLTERDFIELPNVGRKSLAEVRRYLAMYGLKLRSR